MSYTITIDDDLAQRIDNYLTSRTDASDAEEAGGSPDWERIDDDAHGLIDSLTDLPRCDENDPPTRPVDDRDTDESIRITVIETTVSILHVHPDRFPAEYDLFDDTEQLLDTAVADAVSHRLGQTEVRERHISGLV